MDEAKEKESADEKMPCRLSFYNPCANSKRQVVIASSGPS
jgi:hypothetical protein